MFPILELFVPLAKPVVAPSYVLKVSLTYIENNVYEDVTFRNIDGFDIVKEEVKLHSWRVIVTNGDNADDIVGEGRDVESLEKFYLNFEENVKNA